MSTNIHIRATRAILVEKTGKKSQETISFNAWQTPTAVTLKIIESDDKVRAYKNWVMSISKDEEVNVYAEDDIFGEREPVGVEVINEGKYHIERLDDWLANCKEDGYEIEFEAW